MNKYNTLREENAQKKDNDISKLVRIDLPAEIMNELTLSQTKGIKTRGSVGQYKQWARVPWFALIDSRYLEAPRLGVYVVVLFKEDMDGFYLCLEQGVQFFDELSNIYKENFSKKVIGNYFERFNIKIPKGFEKNINNLFINNDKNLNYEDSTFISKYYSLNDIQKNKFEVSFLNDVSQLLDSYNDLTLKIKELSEEKYESEKVERIVYDLLKKNDLFATPKTFLNTFYFTEIGLVDKQRKEFDFNVYLSNIVFGDTTKEVTSFLKKSYNMGLLKNLDGSFKFQKKYKNKTYSSIFIDKTAPKIETEFKLIALELKDDLKPKIELSFDLDIQSNNLNYFMFLGNNGVGKSQVLSALSVVFREFYDFRKGNISANIRKKHSYEFYKLVFLADGETYELKFQDNKMECVRVNVKKEDREEIALQDVPFPERCISLTNSFFEKFSFSNSKTEEAEYIYSGLRRNDNAAFTSTYTENLIPVISYLDKYNPELKEIILNFTGFENMKIIEKNLFLYKNDREIEFDSISSGQANLLRLLFTIAFYAKNNSLILIDEPEESLHPEWQQSLIDIIDTILTKTNVKATILIASHSPYLVSSMKPNNSVITIFKKDLEGNILTERLDYSVESWSVESVLYRVFNVRTYRNIFINSDMETIISYLSGENENKAQAETALNNLEVLPLPKADPLFEFINIAKKGMR